MKILVVGDIHFSVNSSIVRSREDVYSTRITNCLQSIDFVERLSESENCELIVYLGDFFDKDTLNSEELTAIQTINWSPIKKIILVGNHEMGVSDLSKSSSHILNLIPNSTVVDSPNAISGFGYRLIFLPYILEENRKPIKKYIQEIYSGYFETQEVKSNYIFSHNDLKGVQMGRFVSEEGFTIKDLEDNCTYCFNGHLHNGCNVTDKIINVGNLTGHDFSEDATKYRHNVYVLNTDTESYRVIDNPFAFNVIKCEINDESDLEKVTNICSSYNNIVLSVKCVDTLCESVKTIINSCKNICEYRLTTIVTSNKKVSPDAKLVNTDYISQFCSYIIETLGDNEVVSSELQKVIG